MAKKTETSKKAKSTVTLGEALMVFTKSSSHWLALLQPEIVSIEDIKFLQGIQVTGKEGHRMERKRTLVPFDLVTMLIEFPSEDELWSEPQPRHIRPPDETNQNVTLTSHEQPQQQPNKDFQHHQREHHHGNRHHRHKGNRFHNRHHQRRDDGFDKE